MPALSLVDIVVLAAVDGECTGANIAASIEGAARGRTLFAKRSLYIALNRLERAGLIVFRWRRPEGLESHRTRRVFRVTGEGEEAVVETRRILDQLSAAKLDARPLEWSGGELKHSEYPYLRPKPREAPPVSPTPSPRSRRPAARGGRGR